MKHLKLWSILMLAVLMMPLVASCGGDDSSDGGGGRATDSELISKAIGTWMCTESTDTQQGKSYQGMMVGKEVTINAGGTYTSTAPSFGYSGTYSVSGNKITAKSDAGGTFVITVTIKGDNMTWEGTASNGVTFKYIFQRESTNPSTILAFTKELITASSWVVEGFNIVKGSNSSIQKGKTITFKNDGSCEAFHSMENAWRITNGRIETYYKQTNEPMFVYTLLSQKDGNLTVRMNGTLDDNLEATLTLAKKDDEPSSITTETFWTSKDDVLSLYASCYSACTTFALAQYNLEKIRINPTTVHRITSTSNEVSSTWVAAYQTIMRINTILDYREDISRLLTSLEYTELIAEMTAMRAFIYYNLAVLWGDVPIVKTSNVDEGTAIAQSKQFDVFAFAYSEISNVIGNLKQSSSEVSKYYLTSDVGYLLKAELEMTLGNHTQAKNTLNQIDGSRYVVTRSSYGGTPGTSIIWGLNQVGVDAFFCVFDYKHLYLYNKESSKVESAAELEQEWQNNNMKSEYGYWAALKRLKLAQTITGCDDYELLMPIPQNDLIQNPSLKQNSGY